MPPFDRYWFTYLVAASLAGGLVVVAVWIWPVDPATPTPAILFSGVVVAFVSILSTNLSQWRSLRAQATLQAVQTLRTDREYLINALKVENAVGTLGQDLSPELIALFRGEAGPSSVDAPSFSQASRFLLNQYEFIAAACREGLLDERLLRMTIRGGLCALVRSYRPLIAERRESKPRTMENLVWLFQRFDDGPPIDLGPEVTPGAAARRLGWILGTTPAGRS